VRRPGAADECGRRAQQTCPQQVWPLYNRAQATEKERFRELLSDLCHHLPDPPARPGRPPHPLRDRVFARTLQVYCSLSRRRFSCDLRDAHGDAGGIWEKMYHYFAFRRDEFLSHYHLRSNGESTFSRVKAKFGAHVRSKTDVAMKNEVLGKFLAHNRCVVHQSHVELGIEPGFWGENRRRSEIPAVLPLARPG
jgi:hypothetical protein